MNDKLRTVIKLTLELMRETDSKQNKYYLAQAHNYLMEVMLDEKQNNQ